MLTSLLPKSNNSLLPKGIAPTIRQAEYSPLSTTANSLSKADTFELKPMSVKVSSSYVTQNVRNGVLLEFDSATLLEKSKSKTPLFYQLAHSQLAIQHLLTVPLINEVLSTNAEPFWMNALNKALQECYSDEPEWQTFLYQFGDGTKSPTRKGLANALQQSDRIESKNKGKIPQFLNKLDQYIINSIKQNNVSPSDISTLLSEQSMGLFYEGMEKLLAENLKNIANHYPALGQNNPIAIELGIDSEGLIRLGLYEANRLKYLPKEVELPFAVGGHTRNLIEAVPVPDVNGVDSLQAELNHRARKIAMIDMVKLYFPTIPDEQIKQTETEQLPTELFDTEAFSLIMGNAYNYLFYSDQEKLS